VRAAPRPRYASGQPPVARVTLRLRCLGGLALLHEGTPLAGPGAQRRRLALLSVLAASGGTGVSREFLSALFWSDSDSDRARHALAQLLYLVRRSPVVDPIIATPSELRLDPAVCSSDVADFDARLRTGAPRR
jgi:DNA-binding SARP family transcriptional activator